MESFCGSKFWDLNVTWYTETPDLTPCFEKTILVWIPCAFLWLCSPFEIAGAWKKRRRNGIKSLLHESILFLTLILVLINLVRFIYAFFNFNPSAPIFPVDHVAPALKAVTYILAFCIRSFNNARGIHRSGVLFFFWLLSASCDVFEFQTQLRNPPTSKKDDQGLWTFAVILLSFPAQVVLTALNSWRDGSATSTLGDLSHQPCPEESASILSRLFFTWVCPLLFRGYRRPMEVSDLWLLRPDDQASDVISRFNKYWIPAFEKCRDWNRKLLERPEEESPDENDIQVLIGLSGVRRETKTAGILGVIWKVHKLDLIWGTVLMILADLVLFASPQILDLLIQHVDSEEEDWKGYFYAALMFLSTTLYILFLEHHILVTQTVGMRTNSALNSIVYRKSLVISNAGRREFTTGEIVNLMSIDAQKFSALLIISNDLWASPFEISMSMYFLYQHLGPAIFAGFGVLVLLVPVTAVIAHFREKVQIRLMTSKDRRVKVINEVLAGIKVLKMYAWEPSFEAEIQTIRDQELAAMRKIAFLDSFSEFVWYTAPFMVTFVIFATYVLIDPSHVLDPRKAFVGVTLLNIMRLPMSTFPQTIAQIVQTKVSVNRLNKFLNAEEFDPNDISREPFIDGNKNKSAIKIVGGEFSWDAERIGLRNINLDIQKSSLVAVVGVVGSGKSSLLSAVLGEMKKLVGSVNISGSIAYVPQQAWIQNDTLKGNILFGKTLNNRKYQQILTACALRPDLEVLPGGDNTEIGEKGINLSGGQKQRVALARAAYHDADVYLLDDPLSAVDAHVGKHLFEEVIGPQGILKTKTRLVVTHGLTYLSQADCIVVMKDGGISEVGTFQELLHNKGAFADVLREYLSPEDLEAGVFANMEGLDELKESSTRRTIAVKQTKMVKTDPGENPSSLDKLIEEERSETGNVDRKVYFHYLRNIGWGVTAFTLSLHFLHHGSVLSSNIWLALWSMESPTSNGTQDISKRNLYLSVYGGLGVFQAMFVFVATLSLALGSLRAAKLLHNQMLQRILRSPMSFFDTTPLGRILNRFSKDTDVADSDFPWNIRTWLNCLLEVVVTIIAVSYSTPWILMVFLPVFVLYYWIARFYVPSSRQLKRLESVSRSPIYSHLSETLAGTATIRAFSAQSRFIKAANRNLDANLMAFFPSLISNRWLGLALQSLGNVVTFFTALLAVITRPDPGTVGLSLTYALNMVVAFSWMVRNASSVETNAVAIERMKEYGEISQEAPWERRWNKPSSTWPQHGRIQFKNFRTRYREGLDLVLRNITCEIRPGEKVGIVGRTGAGKSSMTLGLFRIIEAAGGSIVIDGIDIARLGLHDLRQKLTIIPQDPVLFAGTLRMNLDPFETYSDSEVWTAIEFAHLKDAVMGFSEGLQHLISEGGENLSVGQRQLVCLARALLRKTKILILDEATAAVDLETDDLIQATIRKEFQDCTVLTIAHRLHTILDYTRVMVLDNGEIIEFDHPQSLLANSGSLFHQMAENAGVV